MTARILLADDSPHAQRMGERILREEGFEVICVTDGAAALRKLEETDPDLALADVFLPGVSGYELCRHIKGNERRRHTAVVLIAGLLEPVDEAEASRVAADGVLKKPFEASGVLETIRPLIDKAQQARGLFAAALAAGAAPPAAEPGLAPKAPEIDPERVRAAVTIALDRSLPQMVNEITEKVLIALGL